MDVLWQCIINSISLGAIYTIIALSTTILYGTLRNAHSAQGDIYAIGMLLGFTFFVNASLPFFISIILSIIITAGILIVIQWVIYQPMYKVSSLYVFISGIAMATFLRNMAQVIFGSESYSFPHLLGSTPWQITPTISILPQSVIIIGAGIVLVVVLMLFMHKTKLGLAMSAVSMNKYAASIMGVNFSKIATVTYGISAAMAAIAGVLTAPLYTVNATVGANIGGKALIAAVMGGFGNPTGAILGGMLLGIIETFGSFYISSAYKDAFAYIALFIILFVRPQGFLGRKSITKV